MSKITRASQKIFGLTGGSGDFGEFGSLAAGAVNYTKDPAIIQDLAAWLTGWSAATIADNRPALEDMNSLFFLAYYQICYLLQAGIPEWDSGTTYYEYSYCQVAGVIYKSLQDTNLNKNPATETAWWVVALDESTYVRMTGNETIAGIKTFSSSPIVPTPSTDYQASTKKYVDDEIAAVPAQVGFGAWVDKSASYGAQQASTDGFVVAILHTSNTDSDYGYSDSANPPTVVRAKFRAQDADLDTTMCFPVKKNDFWKIEPHNTPIAVYWIPLGS